MSSSAMLSFGSIQSVVSISHNGASPRKSVSSRNPQGGYVAGRGDGAAASAAISVVRNPLTRCPHELKSCVQNSRGMQEEKKSLMICASLSGGKELYQPFRPPVLIPSSPAGAATVEQQLQVLRERQGLWYVYATVIPALARAGFNPNEIDEATGLNGHEQNQLVVGAQVRDSLIATAFDPESLAWFDVSGAERLYELRVLSALERKAAAYFVIERNMDPKLVRDLARSIKDFPRRKSREGFSSFSTAPGDCLAFALYRQSKESTNEAEAEEFLNRALEFAVTEKAKGKILSALGQGEEEVVTPELANLQVFVARISSETTPLVLPVADFSPSALAEAPSNPPMASYSINPFNILRTETPWTSWVAIPSSRPIETAVAPVALLVPDGTVLPKQIGIKLTTDPILIVVDKGDREIVSDSFFLVEGSGGSLILMAGPNILPSHTVLGKVLIALKPPLPVDPNIDRDWE